MEFKDVFLFFEPFSERSTSKFTKNAFEKEPKIIDFLFPAIAPLSC
jgi:hypothetical protein